MNEKRKRITDKILEVVGLLDTKDKFNYTKYKEMFDGMTDEQFGDFCNWCNDPEKLDQLDHTIFIQTLPFEEPPLSNILKGLEVINVPADEYIYFRDFNTKTPIRSRYPVSVGYITIKRMEQLLSKKNRYSLDNDKRSIKSDQVSGDSKVAAISDSEAAALISQGADDIFKEMYGSRSGDEKARNKLYRDIALNGYATLADVNSESNEDSKFALNTLNTYLLSAGLRSDLVSNSLKLPFTIKKELKGNR